VRKKKKKICLKKSLPYIDRKTKEKRRKKYYFPDFPLFSPFSPIFKVFIDTESLF
jgi:hypothetical protein